MVTKCYAKSIVVCIENRIYVDV